LVPTTVTALMGAVHPQQVQTERKDGRNFAGTVSTVCASITLAEKGIQGYLKSHEQGKIRKKRGKSHFIATENGAHQNSKKGGGTHREPSVGSRDGWGTVLTIIMAKSKEGNGKRKNVVSSIFDERLQGVWLKG